MIAAVAGVKVAVVVRSPCSNQRTRHQVAAAWYAG